MFDIQSWKVIKSERTRSFKVRETCTKRLWKNRRHFSVLYASWWTVRCLIESELGPNFFPKLFLALLFLQGAAEKSSP